MQFSRIELVPPVCRKSINRHWPGCLTALSDVKRIGLPLVPRAFSVPSMYMPTFELVNWTVMPGSGVRVTPLLTNRSEVTV